MYHYRRQSTLQCHRGRKSESSGVRHNYYVYPCGECKCPIKVAKGAISSSLGDGTAFTRFYLNRPSAPKRDIFEDAKERVQIFDECQALRTCAANCLNEEFLRANALRRDEVFAELEALKLYAKLHLHPELPVETTHPFACQQNCFDRPSAPERERHDAEEHHCIREDARQLEGLVQKQHVGHVLERDAFHCVLEADYSHCNFSMDEDLRSMEHDEPVLDYSEERAPARVTAKRDDDNLLSSSPSSIFQFAM